MEDRILFVDDEEFVLAAFRRHLRNKYVIETALSGAEGLEKISTQGPFAVVVADLQMPGMDGVQFLSEVKNLSPDTVRIMLTGHADLQKAIEAVNEGNIFRFLTKPSPPETLNKALQSGLQQYRLVTAEKVLTEKTLKSSIRLLTDILSMSNPTAFSQTLRLRQIVHAIVEKMKLPYAWEVELAALLSQIGCIMLPKSLLDKVSNHEKLTPAEAKLYQSHPYYSYRWLENIPRLETVAKMIRDQQKPFAEYPFSLSVQGRPKHEVGAQILKAALDYDAQLKSGVAPGEAIRWMSAQEGVYNPNILEFMMDQDISVTDLQATAVSVQDLEPGMMLGDDVCARDGELLAHQSQILTEPLCAWLQLIAQTRGVVEPLRVFILPN